MSTLVRTRWTLIALCSFSFFASLFSQKQIARPEHPKPQSYRESWVNLNGRWDFAFDFDLKRLEGNWQQNQKMPESRPASSWVEPDRTEPPGTKYGAFKSKTLGSDVRYLVYLPPGYRAQAVRRFPVIYFLHGLGQTQRAGAEKFVPHLDRAIRTGMLTPAIAVVVNGLRDSFYVDSPDGEWPVETVIVKELVPHIDETYYTIRGREGRAIEGYSMGGFGAAHLGFKYPDVFGLVSVMAGALLSSDSMATRHGPIYQKMFSGQKECFDSESPIGLAVERKSRLIRDRARIRIAVGGEDHLLELNRQLQETLTHLGITNQFQVIPGVAHSCRSFYETLGADAFQFYDVAWGQWNDPDRSDPPLARYRSFWSRTAGTDVSYLLYLPPDYERNPNQRYPVIYWLHGLNGGSRHGLPFAERLDAAIRTGKSPPAIAVLVTGLRGSFYCDSRDRTRLVETVIIKDLLPHVDRAYRSIAKREARAIEGFSMGGFGAAHLGFKYPSLFGAVSVMAGALLTSDTVASRHRSLFERVFGGNAEYYRANNPYTLVRENAGAIRGKTFIRVGVGEEDRLLERNKQFHELLTELKIEHEYFVIPGVGHERPKFYERLGDQTGTFYQTAFGAISTRGHIYEAEDWAGRKTGQPFFAQVR